MSVPHLPAARRLGATTTSPPKTAKFESTSFSSIPRRVGTGLAAAPTTVAKNRRPNVGRLGDGEPVANPAGLFALSRRRAVMRRFLLASASALALLLTLGLAPAAAAPPEEKFNIIEVDDEFVAPRLTAECGFTVMVTDVGTIKESGFVDEAGNFVVTQASFHITRTFIGPTGASLSVPIVGVDKIVENPDGTVTVTSTGINALRQVVPGEGLVLADIGRVVTTFTFDPETGEEVEAVTDFEAGQRPEDFDQAEAFAAVCAYLAG
jgi:hypothetical protein